MTAKAPSKADQEKAKKEAEEASKIKEEEDRL
jgi:hypothetical protein